MPLFLGCRGLHQCFQKEGEDGSPNAGEESQVSQSGYAIRCGLKPKVSRAEAVGTVHLPGVRTESRDFGGRRPS